MDDAPLETVAVAGRHCESGDVLVRGRRRCRRCTAATCSRSPRPAPTRQSMASTYNLVPRAAAVIVEDGRSVLATRRETVAELLAREL